MRKIRSCVSSWTLIFPSWAPVANISVSLLKHIHNTASSIIMKLSWAWYFRSCRTQRKHISQQRKALHHGWVLMFTLKVPFGSCRWWSSKPRWTRLQSLSPGTDHRGRSGNTPRGISVQTVGERKRSQVGKRCKIQSKWQKYKDRDVFLRFFALECWFLWSYLDLSAEQRRETLLLYVFHSSFTPEQVDGHTRRQETLMLLPLQGLKDETAGQTTTNSFKESLLLC